MLRLLSGRKTNAQLKFTVVTGSDKVVSDLQSLATAPSTAPRVLLVFFAAVFRGFPCFGVHA